MGCAIPASLDASCKSLPRIARPPPRIGRFRFLSERKSSLDFQDWCSAKRISLRMSGRRSLTPNEERKLRRVVRQFQPPLDRAFLTTMLLGGHRVSEVLSMQIGTILRDGSLVSRIGIAPRCLKGTMGAHGGCRCYRNCVGLWEATWVGCVRDLNCTRTCRYSFCAWVTRTGVRRRSPERALGVS
jgi:hypothetical protein